MWDVILHSNLFNVILALLILGWVANKLRLGKALTARQQALAQQVNEIEQQKIGAQQALQALKQRSEQLHHEIDKILMDARESADHMAHQIIVHAEAEAARIKAQAKHLRTHETNQAKESIEAAFMDQVLASVHERLAQQIDDPQYAEQQQIHIDHVIEDLPRAANHLKQEAFV